MVSNKLAGNNIYDFFDERVGRAASSRDIELTTETRQYLALLLTQPETALNRRDPDTLAELHLKAANANRTEALRLYRTLGDRALYVAGYFAESLERRPVGVSYYADMGGAAYSRVAVLGQVGREVDPWTRLFRELAHRFHDCLELLRDVADQNRAEGCRNLMELYEHFLRTRSQNAARRLGEMGVFAAEPALS